MPGQSEKMCSAVGLRSLFWLQMKRTLRAKVVPEVEIRPNRDAASQFDELFGRASCRSGFGLTRSSADLAPLNMDLLTVDHVADT